MPKLFLYFVFVLAAMPPAFAQWERVSSSDQRDRFPTPDSPHPLSFYLTPSVERDPQNSLCVGCATGDGRKVSLQDYDVQTSTRALGDSFGRKIVQIQYTFRAKKGSVAEQLDREVSSKDNRSDETPPENLRPVKWKSIVMQSSSQLYRELYLVADDGVYELPFRDAALLTVGTDQILATNDPIEGTGATCTDAYWVLRSDGPWLIDFSATDDAVASALPPNSQTEQTRCWAIDLQKLEVRSPVQSADAACHACDWIGHAVVSFKIVDHRAIPVSSHFAADKQP